MSKLAEHDVMAMVAVKNLEAAKKFYGETLGLTADKEMPGVATFTSGKSVLVVYEAPSAGSAQSTCASWNVEDIAATVEELKSKGIKFEHYDMPQTSWEGDVASWGEQAKAAWFKDPDGNILGLNENK
jgi:catechol 2,3-dioxygenase-like lactoylglutathione lyase family enzyme